MPKPREHMTKKAAAQAAFSSDDLAMSLDELVQLVWQKGEELYRDLPWRNTRDPWGVLVSEVMLQQTQVARVLTRWERWMNLFPTVDALAAADTATVLAEWQGMGYNRRALALKRMADEVSAMRAGQLPQTEKELIALPGIGPSTAAGVLAFAYDQPGVYLETNVRTVLIHHLFPEAEAVSDKVLRAILAEICPEKNVRGWYYALMDYGAYLKKTVPNPSRKSAHYTRQSTFEGSRRQKRAELLRCVLADPGVSAEALFGMLNESERKAGRDAVTPDLFESIVKDMVSEGFFRKEGEGYFA